MKELLEKLLPQQRQQLWIALAVCLAAGFVAFVWDERAMSQTEKPEAESVESAATYIPAGHVLVPINVANADSLDSILGKFGVVDLYAPQDDPRAKPRKLAEHIKILRAPLNPNHFAVLVPDSESQKIVAFSGAVTVVVQNPSAAGPALVIPERTAPTPKRKSRVIVEVPNVE